MLRWRWAATGRMAQQWRETSEPEHGKREGSEAKWNLVVVVKKVLILLHSIQVFITGQIRCLDIY